MSYSLVAEPDVFGDKKKISEGATEDVLSIWTNTVIAQNSVICIVAAI